MDKSDKWIKALTQMERFCAYQERSLHEVEQKLHKTELSESEKLCMLDWLREENFLNEERFARAYVRGKFRIKLWGRQKIAAELYKHKVNRSRITEALAEEIGEEPYRENIRLLIHRKLRTISGDPDSFTLRNKLLSYLTGKGYETGPVLEELSEIMKDI